MPLLLLLLLEMAGTCYIITEGGKTHTFQQYLQQKTLQAFESPTHLRPALKPEQTDGEPDVRSHLSAPRRSAIRRRDDARPSPTPDPRRGGGKGGKHSCESPPVSFVCGLANSRRICAHRSA